MASSGALAGKRVLLVEDEVLVAMLIEDMLADEDCVLVAHIARLTDAIALAADATVELNLAILDVNVAGQPVFAVAEALAARGVPFVFTTGYGPGALPAPWVGRPTLTKPFTMSGVVQALERVLAGG